MTIGSGASNRVTVHFDTKSVRQEPLHFDNYRQAIVAVMKTVAMEDRESAIIRGHWNTIEYREIARHYENMVRLKLI